MSDPLPTYLSDHLAGSLGAVDLLRFLCDHHADEPLGRFAAEILVDVEKDRDVLKGLLERVGSKRGSILKNGIAWLGEKVVRIKMHRRATGGLGTLLALESLELGIRGKQALWRALDVAKEEDRRLGDLDFDHLAARAQAQFDKVEERRLDAARAILRQPEA